MSGVIGRSEAERLDGEPVVDVPGAIAKTEAALLAAVDVENAFRARLTEAEDNLRHAVENTSVLRRLYNSLRDYWDAVAPEPEARELRRPPAAPPTPEEDLQLGGEQ